jgi:hypothetical protein
MVAAPRQAPGQRTRAAPADDVENGIIQFEERYLLKWLQNR